MKAKFGAIVVDGRGKIGGHVASKNRSGAFFRTKVTPINNNTTYQETIRTIFGNVAQAWGGLTVAQRTAWNNAVDRWKKTDVFGDLRTPSGKTLHQRLSTQAQIAGYSALTSPPVPTVMPSNVMTVSLINTGGGTLSFTSRYTGSDMRVMLFASGTLSPGIMAPKGKLFLITTFVANAYSTTFNYNQYVAKYGTPTAGDNVFIGVKYVNANGQATPLQIVKATVS